MAKRTCGACKTSHLKCDGQRPCTRCLKRRIGHLCGDPVQVQCELFPPDPQYFPGEKLGEAYSHIFDQEQRIHTRHYDSEASCAFVQEFNRKQYVIIITLFI